MLKTFYFLFLDSNIILVIKGVCDFKHLMKCGWSDALESSKAAYKSEILVEKPRVKSPSPPVHEVASDDEDTIKKSLYQYLTSLFNMQYNTTNPFTVPKSFLAVKEW